MTALPLRHYRWIIACSLLAAVLWVVVVPTQPFSDFRYYHQLARQIAAGGSWGDTYTAVGYSIFLAGFYRLFGASLWVAKGLNLLLFLLNNLLALRLLRSLPLTERLRRWVFICFAFFPIQIYYTSIVGTETLFTTLLLLALSTYASRWRHRYLLLGAITGLASMVKPFFPAFAAVILLTDALTGERPLLAMRRAATVLLVCALVLAPWLYRNYRLIGQFTYVSNNGGIVLYINNNSQNTTGGWMRASDVADSVVNTEEYQAANMTEKNHMLSNAAKQWIKAHPREFVVLGLKRLQRTFLMPNDIAYSLQGTGYSLRLQHLLMGAVELVRFPLYLIGCLSMAVASLRYAWTRSIRRQPSALCRLEVALLLTFWMFAGVYFLTEGQSRYAFPTILMQSYFAAKELAAVHRRFSARQAVARVLDR